MQDVGSYWHLVLYKCLAPPGAPFYSPGSPGRPAAAGLDRARRAGRLAPPPRETELAGEVLVATQGDGGAFIQFTKSPFTLVVAQSTAESGKWSSLPRATALCRPGRPPEETHLAPIAPGADRASPT